MSPYFPRYVENSSYFCPNCKAWYRRSNVSCTVAHSPWSCCHEHETQVPAPVKPRHRPTKEEGK